MPTPVVTGVLHADCPRLLRRAEQKQVSEWNGLLDVDEPAPEEFENGQELLVSPFLSLSSLPDAGSFVPPASPAEQAFVPNILASRARDRRDRRGPDFGSRHKVIPPRRFREVS